MRAYLCADAYVKPTCSECTLRGDHVPGKLVATPVIAANSISGASAAKHSSQSAAMSAVKEPPSLDLIKSAKIIYTQFPANAAS